ncbi:MAG: hypothetical protein P4L33_18740 [Capsulimonadaceae bacterium]|nr:hypothetical protein [Capsulimonadaceae bacterium]
MKISARITRVGLALLLFGFISALLPDTGTALAAGGACNGGSATSTTQGVVLAGVAGTAAYGAAGGFGKTLFARRRHSSETPAGGLGTPAWPSGNLDSYIYQPQGPIGSVPAKH